MKRIIFFTLCLLPFIGVMAITPSLDTKKAKWGYVDDKGKWVVKPKYEEAGPFKKMPNGKKLSEVKLKGLTGFVDESGKLLSPGVVFESVEPLGHATALVSVKGKTGVIDYDCRYIIEPKLTELQRLPDDGGYVAAFNGKTGVFRLDGSWVIKPEYTAIDASTDGYFKVFKGKKCGITSLDGALIIAPKDYSDITVGENYWRIYKSPTEMGLYSPKKKCVVLKTEYDDVADAFEMNNSDYVIAKKKGKYGIVVNGEVKMKPEYEDVYRLTSSNSIGLKKGSNLDIWSIDYRDYIRVKVTGEDSFGNMKILTGEIKKYRDSMDSFSKRHFPQKEVNFVFDVSDKLISKYFVDYTRLGDIYIIEYNNGVASGFDKNGRVIFTNQRNYRQAERIKDYLLIDGTAITLDGKKFAVKNIGSSMRFVQKENGNWEELNSGKEYEDVDIIATKHVKTSENKLDGYATVKQDGKWGVVKDGKVVLDFQFVSPVIYDDELDGFMPKGNGYGLYTKEGKKILDTEYADIKSFNNGAYFILAKEGRYGALGNDGKSLVDFAYNSVEGFDDGWYVATDAGMGVLDKNNNMIIVPSFQKIERNDAGCFNVKKDDKWGMIDALGRTLISPVYDEVELNEAGQYWVKKGDKWGAVDSSGRTVVSPSYDEIELMSDNKIYKADNSYFSTSGKAIPRAKRVRVNRFNEGEFGRWNGLNYSFSFDFYEYEPITIEINFYKGKKCTASVEDKITPDSPFYSTADTYILYHHYFDNSWGSWDTYTAKLTFRDSDGRVIKVSGPTSCKIRYKGRGKDN